MSYITFQCYACSKNLKVPAEKAGRKAKCNQCGTVLTIPAQSSEPANPPSPAPPQAGYVTAAPTGGHTAVDPSTAVHYPQPAPEQPFEPTDVAYVPAPAAGGYPQPGAGGMPGGYPAPAGGFSPYPGESGEYPSEEYTDVSKRPNWNMVRLGMLLCFIGACVMAGAFALHVIGYLLVTIPLVQLLSGSFPGTDSGDTPRVLLLISTLVSLFATITAIVGYVFCMIGPNKRGSMGLSIAVLSIAVLEILLIMIFQLPGLFGQNFLRIGTNQSFFGTWLLYLLIQLLFGAEVILFPLVVRAFALSLKKKMHAKSAMVSLFLAGAYTGERLLTFIFWLVANNIRSPDAGRVFGWIMVILLWLGIFAFIAFIIIYTIFLFKSWKIIPQKT